MFKQACVFFIAQILPDSVFLVLLGFYRGSEPTPTSVQCGEKGVGGGVVEGGLGVELIYPLRLTSLHSI